MSGSEKVQLIIEVKEKLKAGMSSAKEKIRNGVTNMKANLVDLKNTYIQAFSAMRSDNAFHDLQFGAQVFGKDAVMVFKEIGDYSALSGGQVGSSINSAVRAMQAFKVEAKNIRGLLDGNAKAVQVGVASFDELARAQLDCAGSATAAGQGGDIANKHFTSFASIAKAATNGAAMVKSAFEAIVQTSTAKELESISAKFSDATSSSRKLNDRLASVSEKFKAMDSRGVNTLRDKLGGSKGLRNMLSGAKTGADALQATFNGIATSNIGTGIAEIGEQLLPLWGAGLSEVKNVLGDVYQSFGSVMGAVQAVEAGIGLAKNAMTLFNNITKMNIFGLIISLAITGITYLAQHTEGWGDSFKAVWSIAKMMFKEIGLRWELLNYDMKTGIEVVKLKFASFGEYIKQLFSNVGTAIKLAFSGDFSGAKKAITASINTSGSAELEKLKSERSQGREAIAKEIAQNRDSMGATSKNFGIRWKSNADDKNEAATGSNLGAAPSFSSSNDNLDSTAQVATSSSIASITDSANTAKNITVNIDTLGVKGDLHTAGQEVGQMSPEQIEDWFSNILMRTIRNLEMNY